VVAHGTDDELGQSVLQHRLASARSRELLAFGTASVFGSTPS
jgi:hypothetical protein